MIATHPDADHVGGLDEVLKAYKVESVYAPKVSHTTQAFKNFLLAVKNEKLTIKTEKVGVSLPLSLSDTSLSIFIYPSRKKTKWEK
ncbi:metallo-beta-lactamase superfamily protein [Paenisporosarcina sp. OV554]|nr:MBL fold metallo-hydrolase [Paenisporosarcina sp. OV554]PUB10795.1 metallo-beta-lactamase superfamily protein [Paenisporosarcina sp. OV554]